eukprot:snap_masked-scaffold_21-processed-gene-4.6-mRNA-1 protein AED:0.01 eAED:0.01 QI:0/-1/0/1/-1/1/1/0/583
MYKAITQNLQRHFRKQRFLSTQTSGKQRITVFDTTLRDGEQSPGATLTQPEKLEIAKHLSKMRVDVCEAGFPIASPGDFESVKAIAQTIGSISDNRMDLPEEFRYMKICGLSRAIEKDIKRCYDAVKHAKRHRIHTFIATSDIHLEHKLLISREECIEQAGKAVSYAKSLVEDVEFSCEDACRSDKDFLVQVISEVIKQGARTINIPDTVGYTTPEEYQQLISYLVEHTKNVSDEQIIFSTHCHNDLGLATANTLAGIQGGARQVELTVNGIGERAGNTAIEELVMTLNTRENVYPFYTDIDTTAISRASRLVSTFTGMSVQPNKAIVGSNAFAHEAGIHQDGVLKHPETYEIMKPESIGLSTNQLVLGKHSGKAAYKQRLIDLGYDNFTEEEVENLTQEFKRLADQKKIVTDADIESIVINKGVVSANGNTWELVSLHVSGGNSVKPTATVTLRHKEGYDITEASIGSGPVDAIYQAVHRVVRVPNRLVMFNVAGVTKGIDAVGEVLTKLESPEEFDMPDQRRRLQRTDSGADVNEVRNPQTGSVSARTFTGHGADTDILVASARSYLSALNRMINHQKSRM